MKDTRYLGKIDPTYRKRIGDFACFLYLVIGRINICGLESLANVNWS